MQRRSYLNAVAAIGIGSTAGCLSRVLEDRPENVYLSPQEDQIADSEDLAYPAYGEPFPEFELPDPISGTTVSTGQLDRAAFVTAFFAFCPAECAILLRRLAEVQSRTIEAEIEDSVVFLPITFDPERDDAAALEEHGSMVGVDFEAGNWHYLRPADHDEAKSIVEDRLGIGFKRTETSDRDVEGYDFTHSVITMLVNPDGVVERAYRGEDPEVDRLVSDVEKVVELAAE
ncbi:MAG: SCO family protein [Natronomonas sp.]